MTQPGSPKSSRPSEAALKAAKRATRDAQRGTGRLDSSSVPSALAAAHDPALGLERSVRLGDVVEALRTNPRPRIPDALNPLDIAADFIAERFS